MKIYTSLADVLQNMNQLSWERTLFSNSTVWHSSPAEAKFIYPEGDDELEDIADG